jgi:hypothetical protein
MGEGNQTGLSGPEQEGIMKKTVVRITTADTRKTYEFPSPEHPQIWEAKISLEQIGNDGNYAQSKCSRHSYPSKTIYLELETLQKAGLKSYKYPNIVELPQETAEDLIIRLLEHVGVYPTE